MKIKLYRHSYLSIKLVNISSKLVNTSGSWSWSSKIICWIIEYCHIWLWLAMDLWGHTTTTHFSLKKNTMKRLIEFFVFKTESSSTPRASIVLIVKVKSQKTDIDIKKNKETLHRFLPNIYIFRIQSQCARVCKFFLWSIYFNGHLNVANRRTIFDDLQISV